MTETVREVHEVLTRFSPEEGVIELERHGEPVRLRFHESDLLELLPVAGAHKTDVWGEGLSDEEAAARWLAVYLDESVETQQAEPSGWWVYGNHWFEPLQKREAAVRRLRPDGAPGGPARAPVAVRDPHHLPRRALTG